LYKLAWGGVLVVSFLALMIPLRLPVYDLPVQAPTPDQETPHEPDIAVATGITPAIVQTAIPETEPTIKPGSALAETIAPVRENQSVLKKPLETTVTEKTASPVIHRHDVFVAVFVIWCTGVVVLLIKWLRLHWKLTRYLKTLQRLPCDPDVPVTSIWQRLLAGHGLAKTAIPLLLTDSLGPAFVRCGLRSYLLMPRTVCEELTGPPLEGLLRHELAHHLHRDAIITPVLRLIATLQWFQPLAWLTLRRYETAAEWSCDEFAYLNTDRLDSETPGSAILAETFLTVHRSTESLTFNINTNMNTFARSNTLRRVARLARFETLGKESLMKKTLVLALLCLVFFFGMIRIQLVAGKSQTESESSASVETPAEPAAAPVVQDPFFEAFAEKLPESVETERLEKIKAYRNLSWYEKQNKEKYEREMLRIVKTLESPELRADQIMAFACSAAEAGDWEKYDTFVNELDEPYHAIAVQYKQAWRECEAGNREAARKILLDMISERACDAATTVQSEESRLKAVVVAHFHFGMLARLGFVEETRDFLAECEKFHVFGQMNILPMPDSKQYAVFMYYANDIAIDRIFGPISSLIDRKKYDEAFEIACLSYPYDNGMLSWFFAILLDNKECDVATGKYRLLEKKKTELISHGRPFEAGKSGITWQIVGALLKSGDFDRAMQLAREESLLDKGDMASIGWLLHVRFLDTLLQNGKTEECRDFLEETLKRYMPPTDLTPTVTQWRDLVRIQLALGEKKQAEELVEAIKKQCDSLLHQADPEKSGHGKKLDALITLAEVQCMLGNREAALATWQLALEQVPDDMDTSRFCAAVFNKVALSQAQYGIAGEAFSRLSTIPVTVRKVPADEVHVGTQEIPIDRPVSEIFCDIGCTFLRNGDIENAKRALEQAKTRLETNPNVRVFGLVNNLAMRLRKAEIHETEK